MSYSTSRLTNALCKKKIKNCMMRKFPAGITISDSNIISVINQLSCCV